MRLSVVQMNPGADKAANLRQAAELIAACIASDRPEMIALPEMWSCLGGTREAKFDAAECLPPNADPGPAYRLLQQAAMDHGITVHGGSIGERDPASPDRLYNTTIMFGPDGSERARYRKMHLFDITTPDGQGYRESATYGAGDRVVTAEIGDLTVGLAICYDIRFPALFGALRQAGAELIVLPAAFTVQTGRDHWETLIRARAIETQCWFAAAATIGRHVELGRAGPSERQTYGHSMIVDPWGHVVARASVAPGWATARIDAGMAARIRRDMPVVQHRRLP